MDVESNRSDDKDALRTFEPSDIETDVGFHHTLLRLAEQKRQGVIPAIVTGVNQSSGRVSVKPLVKYVKETKSGDVPFDRPVYHDIPILRSCHGRYVLDFPVFVGDTGLLLAVDRAWNGALEKNRAELRDHDTKFKNNEGPQSPDHKGMCSFEWGVFVPMSFSSAASGGTDTGADLVVKRLGDVGQDGKEVESTVVSVTLGDGGITIRNKDDVIRYSPDEGFSFSSTREESMNDRFDVVTDIRYDMVTHQMQKKVRSMLKRGGVIVGIGEESSWKTMSGGQAVPVKSAD